MEIAMLVLAAIGVAAAIIAALPPLGVDIRIFGRPNMPLEGIPHFRARQAWIAIVVALISLGISMGAFYYFFRPRVVEKIVEKPVDKLVPQECPKCSTTTVSSHSKKPAKVAPEQPTPEQNQSGHDNAQTGPITQGPNSALSFDQKGGVTAGTYLGNPPPQFAMTVVYENVKQDSSYETKFKVVITTSQSITFHVKVSAQLINDMKIDNERPPQQGGMSFMGTSPKAGNGWMENDYWNIESGSYFVIVHTPTPQPVKLECW